MTKPSRRYSDQDSSGRWYAGGERSVSVLAGENLKTYVET